MQTYKIDLPVNDAETSDHLVSALVSEEEADLLTDSKYVKFVVGPTEDLIHCEIGHETNEIDLLASVARIIGCTYLNLKEEDPTGDKAEMFRETLENAMGDPNFWLADNELPKK
jgi:hypothetical protein